MGKSRLVEAFARRAATMGFAAVVGRCHAREQVDFAVFDRLVDALIAQVKARHIDLTAIEDELALALPLFPALRLVCDVPPADAAVRRRFEAFARLLDHVQASCPLLIALDDLHWVGPDSLALLRYLLPRLRGRVVALLLFRADDVDASHPLRSALDTAPEIAERALDPLSDAAAAALLEALGVDPAASAGPAEGIPFVLHLLARRAGARTAAEALRAEVTELDEHARHVLHLAAVSSGDVSRAVLKHGAGLRPIDFELALGTLGARRLARVRPRRDRLDVYHDQVREAVWNALTEDERARFHRRLAEAYEATAEGTAEDRLRHWTGAGETARRLYYLERAADDAEARFAYARATALRRAHAEETGSTDAAVWARVSELGSMAGRLTDAIAAANRALAADRSIDEAVRLELLGKLGLLHIRERDARAGAVRFAEGLASMGLPFHRSTPARVATLLWLDLSRRLPSTPRRTGPDARARLDFFDRCATGCLFLWPMVAAECGLRTAGILARVDDPALALRDAVMGGMRRVVFDLRTAQISARALASVGRKIDAAEAAARARPTLGGPELLQIGRAVMRFADDLGAVPVALEPVIAALEEQGLGGAFEGTFARAIQLMASASTGDVGRTLRFAGEARRGERRDYMALCLSAACEVSVLAICARIDEARAATERLAGLLEGIEDTGLGWYLETARIQILIAAADFDGAIAALDQPGEHADLTRFALQSAIRAELRLQAALPTVRERPERKRQVRDAARLLLRRGAYYQIAPAHRALAELAAAAGDADRAAREMRRALAIPRVGPLRRWLCLRSARRIIGLEPPEHAELEALEATHGYAPPANRRPEPHSS